MFNVSLVPRLPVTSRSVVIAPLLACMVRLTFALLLITSVKSLPILTRVS